MATYIYQLKGWPGFSWEQDRIFSKLVAVRYRQGRLLGRMEGMEAHLQEEATLHMCALDIVKSSEIEGEILDPGQVRYAVARRLGMEQGEPLPVDLHVNGVVEMMFDATQNDRLPLTTERLFGWHAAMLSGDRSIETQNILVGNYRNNSRANPMQVVSGPIGKEKVHFQAPDSEVLVKEMEGLLGWFNDETSLDPVLKAAIAHLWFVTIHPFGDGNGKITRAITNIQLSHSDQTGRRFYSMSSQIAAEQNAYYDILEKTQKGTLDITDWLDWFLGCLDRAIAGVEDALAGMLKKSRFWRKYAFTYFNERQKLMLNKILDGYGEKLTSSKWAGMTGSSQDTAGRDINDLVRRGILSKESAGGRSTGYYL